MKDGIHPEYNENAKFICVCGTTFDLGSTKAEIKIDVCSNCHPFFTGKHKLLDTEGRIEKFRKKYSTVAAKK